MNEKDVNDFLTSLYTDDDHLSKYGFFSLLIVMFSLGLGIVKMYLKSFLIKIKLLKK